MCFSKQAESARKRRASLKAEAHRRSASKEWFGHIAFASVLARTAA